MPKVTSSGPGFKKLEERLDELSKLVVKAGWFPSAKYETGTSVALVAAVQEFGKASKNIPPRPFMRPTVADRQKEWADLAGQGAKAIIAGNTTPRNVMEAIGLRAAADIAKTISQVYSPPLKPATIMARARAKAKRVRGKPLITGTLQKPLVDTGLMISTVTHTVEVEK